MTWVPKRPEIVRRLWTPGWLGFNAWCPPELNCPVLSLETSPQHSREESRIIPNPCLLWFSDERRTTHIGKCSKIPFGTLVSEGKDLKDEPWVYTTRQGDRLSRSSCASNVPAECSTVSPSNLTAFTNPVFSVQCTFLRALSLTPCGWQSSVIVNWIRGQAIRIQVPTLPLTRCLIWGKFPNCSKPLVLN